MMKAGLGDFGGAGAATGLWLRFENFNVESRLREHDCRGKSVWT